MFKNKGIEMLNIPRIFRKKVLKSYVNFLKVNEPTVVNKRTKSVSNKLFSDNNAVEDINRNLKRKCKNFQILFTWIVDT